MENIILTLSGIALGITAVAGEVGLPSKFKPLFSLIIAVAAGLGLYGLTRDVALAGIIAGLSASGLWSGAKATTKKTDTVDPTGGIA